MTQFTVAPGQVHDELKKALLVDGFDLVLDLDKSQGSYLHCSKSGRKFLDLFTFFASSPIGQNHPRLRDDKVVQMLGRVAKTKPSNSDLYTVEMAEFVKTFREK